MRKLFINILFITCAATLAAQVPLSHDTNFVYLFNDTPPVLQLADAEIYQVLQEPNGNLLVRGNRRIVVVNGALMRFEIFRLNQNGILLPQSFDIRSRDGINNFPFVSRFQSLGNYKYLIGSDENPFLIVDSNGHISANSWAISDSLNYVVNKDNSHMRNSFGSSWDYYLDWTDTTMIIASGQRYSPLPWFSLGPNNMYKLKGLNWIQDTTFTHYYTGRPFGYIGCFPRKLGNQMFASGVFNSYGGHSSRSLVKLDNIYNPDTSFSITGVDTVGPTHIIPILVQPSGKLICTGNYPRLLPNGLIDTLTFWRLNPDFTLDTTFNSQSYSKRTYGGITVVGSLTPSPNGGYLITGRFENFENYDLNGIAVIDSNGFVDTNYLNLPKLERYESWGKDLAAGVYGATVGPAGIYVFGNFNRIDGEEVRGLVRLHGFWPVNTPNITPALKTLQLYPNPAQNQVRINLGQEISKPQMLYLRDISGKLVKTYSITEPYQTLDIGSSVAKGLYFVSVPGFKVQKLVIQ